MIKTRENIQIGGETSDYMPTPEFIDEVVQNLVRNLGSAALVNIEITNTMLPSRENPNITSDDRLTIVWYAGRPAGVALETRNDFNNVNASYAIFEQTGPTTV